jgi:hypothetical protein
MRALVLLPLGLACGAAAAGCIDTSHRCHEPVAWQPCPGAAAQPGASGVPPAITSLMLPTCAFVDAPSANGTLAVSDGDGDAQTVKASFYAGPRVAEAELQLDDARRMGNDWRGAVGLAVPGGSQMASELTFDVRVKVTDRAGNQSAPVCNTFSLVR